MTDIGTMPTGAATFLFTDIEGSTHRWETDADAMATALAVHDALLRDIIEAHGGYVFATTGDGFAAAFQAGVDAALAAHAMQGGLAEVNGAGQLTLRVRIGMATGSAYERDGDYFGPIVNQAARVMAAAHGGQTIASGETVTELASSGDHMYPDVMDHDVIDLGTHRLRDLLAPVHLYQLGGSPDDHPPVNSLDRHDHNLPTLQSTLFGFDEAIVDIAALLTANRAVCLTGIGGIGKTRLAIEVAASMLADHDVTRMIDLSRLVDADQAASAIAAAMQAEDSSIASLIARIGTRNVLLVIDNCEHLLDPIASIAEEILHQCPNARLLATSREALGIEGEQVQRVKSLPTSAAVRLFLDRATALRPALIVDENYKVVVARICARLDGIPLAIELAAGRSNHMQPEELERLLDDRFRLLAGGRRNALQRQQTLEAAMDWSYLLLEPDEQKALQVAAVFRGDFTAASFAHVAVYEEVDALHVLGSLVDKSLLQVGSAADVSRYRLLETVRMYGYDRLVEVGDAAATRSRHAEHYRQQLCAVDLDQLVRHELVANDPGADPHADLWNRIAALEWFEEVDDVGSTALVASLITLSSIGLAYSDRHRRYLERDAVVDQLTAETASLYCFASILNANLYGRFDTQLRFADLGLTIATGTVRIGLLLVGANSAAVFDPDRVGPMITEALDLIDPADGDLRRVARVRQIDPITIHGDMAVAHEALTDLWGDGQPRPISITDLECMAELLFLDYLLGHAELEQRAREWSGSWGNVAHRSRCVLALLATDRGDHDTSAAFLTEAAAQHKLQPYPLAEHDIIICAAIRRVRHADAERAAALLATVPVTVRSPASFRLLVHARKLVKAELAADAIASIRSTMEATDGAALRSEEIGLLAG